LLKRRSIAVLAAALFAGCAHHEDAVTDQARAADARRKADVNTPTLPLVTGKFIEDHLAEQIAAQDVGSMVVNLISTPDRRFAISTDIGARQAVWAIDTTTGKGIAHVDFLNPPGPKGTKRSNGVYYGLAVTPDGGTVFAAQGRHEAIAVLKLVKGGGLEKVGAIATKVGDFPSGLALDARGVLYSVSNDPIATGPTLNTPGELVLYDTKSGPDPRDAKEVGRLTFSDTPASTSNFPLAVAALRDGSKIYVASQRDSCVWVIDASDPRSPKVLGKIASGSHPIALCFNKAQTKLFIANGHSDTVSIVNVKDNAIAATVLLRPEIAADLPGATPTGLCLSPDVKTLYASLGDLNAVAVFDVE
jgi:YVTN family beta-propeller protein